LKTSSVGLSLASNTYDFPPSNSQVSPEILTQGKNGQMAANFLEANFEYFRVLTARGDVNK